VRNSKLIYLVDDDEDDIMLIREALEIAIDDVEIIEAGDGKELLDLVDRQNSGSVSSNQPGRLKPAGFDPVFFHDP
jgi:CheY-like chemotaxis protein